MSIHDWMRRAWVAPAVSSHTHKAVTPVSGLLCLFPGPGWRRRLLLGAPTHGRTGHPCLRTVGWPPDRAQQQAWVHLHILQLFPTAQEHTWGEGRERLSRIAGTSAGLQHWGEGFLRKCNKSNFRNTDTPPHNQRAWGWAIPTMQRVRWATAIHSPQNCRHPARAEAGLWALKPSEMWEKTSIKSRIARKPQTCFSKLLKIERRKWN
jgi:hypothetical protein